MVTPPAFKCTIFTASVSTGIIKLLDLANEPASHIWIIPVWLIFLYRINSGGE